MADPYFSTIPSYFNNLNQLTRVGGEGKTLIEGLINEPGTVKVNGVEAEMISIPGTSEWSFSKEVDVTEGSNTVSIVATDESENSTSESYEYNVASLTSTLSYDGNGNLLSDGQRQYTWDAKNQLLSVEKGGVVTSWVYDGQGRRVEEKVDGILQRRWIWIGLQIAQERDSSGSVVRSFYSSGMSTPMESLVYAVDHLGSVREAIDTSSVTQVVYDYDSWGKRTKLSGSMELAKGYTGHVQYSSLGLIAAPYRFYEPEIGRWISRDPIGEEGGINLYAYVANRPVNWIDPLGLWTFEIGGSGTIGLFIIGGSVNLGIIVDSDGGIGIKLTGTGRVGPQLGLSGGGHGGVSSACNIKDLEGLSLGAFADAGPIGSFEGEFAGGNSEFTNNPKEKMPIGSGQYSSGGLLIGVGGQASQTGVLQLR